MSLIRFLILIALLATVLLQGCASSGATTGTSDCRGLSGGYRDAGEPHGDSLMRFLLKKKSLEVRLVQLDVSAESIRASSGAIAGTLASEKDFNCSGVGRIVLARQESSRIHLPPLIEPACLFQRLTAAAGGKRDYMPKDSALLLDLAISQFRTGAGISAVVRASQPAGRPGKAVLHPTVIPAPVLTVTNQRPTTILSPLKPPSKFPKLRKI